MNLPLSVLRPDDAPRIAELHASAADDPWPVQDYRAMLSQSTCLSLGICDGTSGALNAFALTQIAVDSADLLIIATAPELRRNGLARALLRNLLNRFGERGLARFTLDVAEDNEGAIALYQSMGFAEDGRRPNYYRRAAGRIDAILMSRAITGLPSNKKA